MKNIIIAYILCMLCVNVNAQDNGDLKGYWLNSGYGFNTLPGNSFYLSLNVQYNVHQFTLRLISNTEKIKSATVIVDPMEQVGEIGVLYGRNLQAEFGMVSFSGGLSAVFGQKRGDLLDIVLYPPLRYEFYEMDKFVMPGLALEVTGVFMPIDWFGIGITGFANINPKRVFAGLVFIGTIGKFHRE
jgi:hypothetical protein